MKAPFRVVLDTNLFTAQKFEILRHSRFKSLCQSGRVVPVYGHVFLEEMFRAYGNETKRTLLMEHWLPFLVSTMHRLCNDLHGIWHQELVMGRGTKANIFMSACDQEKVVQRMLNLPKDGSWRAWLATADERASEDAKRAAQRETSKEIRAEISQWRKMMGARVKGQEPTPARKFILGEMDYAGREWIQGLVKCADPFGVADRWSRDKQAYPYFTGFVGDMLYMAHYAGTRFNDGIDLNAQADLNLMEHLNRADAVVSNETGFLKSAFDDLWRPLGKVLFTSEEFAAFLRKI